MKIGLMVLIVLVGVKGRAFGQEIDQPETPLLRFESTEEGTSVALLGLIQTYPLEGDTFHVQGIDLEFGDSAAENPDRLFLSSVNKATKSGHLFSYRFSEDVATIKREQEVEVQVGEMYHPGGFQIVGEKLWLPVAEYRPKSRSVVQRRNRNSLELEYQFEVDDHIGAVAADENRLIGANWDARQIYFWDLEGKLTKKLDNPYPTHYQDMKLVESGMNESGTQILLGSGGAMGLGRVDVLNPDDLSSLALGKIGRTDRGSIFTHEGMAISNQSADQRRLMRLDEADVWFLPEDTPSRLFRFRGRALAK